MTDVRRLAPLLIILLAAAGCGGPTRTAGTAGLAAKDLSVVSVPGLPRASPVQIRTVRFDGTDEEYDVGKGRDFYLLPGDRAASFTLLVRPPGASGAIASKFIPNGGWNIHGPRNVPLGTLSAGKSYELVRPVEGFGQLLQGNRFSLLREKQK